MKAYDVKISDVVQKLSIKAEINGMGRKVLLNLANPEYQEIIEADAHLKGVQMEDNDKKSYRFMLFPG